MKKTFLFLLYLTGITAFAQKDTLYVHATPVVSTRVVLYNAEGATQKYVAYADAKDGHFKLAIDKNRTHGVYRLVYNQATMDFVDFLYFGKGFEMSFNTKDLEKGIVFKNSGPNTSYYQNRNKLRTLQQSADMLQVQYFQEKDSAKLAALEQQYQTIYIQIKDFIRNFKKQTQNAWVKDLVLAEVRAQPEQIIKDPESYLPFVKEHFFDAVDFSNEHLIHSPILVDKVMDYVFYLTLAQDTDTQNKLYKEAVDRVMRLVQNQELKSSLLQALIQSFAKEENIVLSDYLFDAYYNKLDASVQKQAFKARIHENLKAVPGRKAKDFSWEENGKSQSLYALKGYDYYLVIFWSSTCPHCLKAMPKVHEYMKDKKRVKVIAVGLETEKSKEGWKSETYYYPEFSHVLALGKWENPIPRDYNVYSTPDFFMLNEEKTIIEKPYELKDIKKFFEKTLR